MAYTEYNLIILSHTEGWFDSSFGDGHTGEVIKSVMFNDNNASGGLSIGHVFLAYSQRANLSRNFPLVSSFQDDFDIDSEASSEVLVNLR
jgi:hypothetical protein